MIDVKTKRVNRPVRLPFNTHRICRVDIGRLDEKNNPVKLDMTPILQMKKHRLRKDSIYLVGGRFECMWYGSKSCTLSNFGIISPYGVV